MKNGTYSTASEYVRSLVRDDQERQAQKRLENLLLEGLESGGAERLTPEDWKEVRRQVVHRLEERQRHGG